MECQQQKYQDVEFNLGEQVLIYKKAIPIGLSPIFFPPWSSPHRVIQKVPSISGTYEIEVINKNGDKRVERVNLKNICKYHGRNGTDESTFKDSDEVIMDGNGNNINDDEEKDANDGRNDVKFDFSFTPIVDSGGHTGDGGQGEGQVKRRPPINVPSNILMDNGESHQGHPLRMEQINEADEKLNDGNEINYDKSESNEPSFMQSRTTIEIVNEQEDESMDPSPSGNEHEEALEDPSEGTKDENQDEYFWDDENSLINNPSVVTEQRIVPVQNEEWN